MTAPTKRVARIISKPTGYFVCFDQGAVDIRFNSRYRGFWSRRAAIEAIKLSGLYTHYRTPSGRLAKAEGK